MSRSTLREGDQVLRKLQFALADGTPLQVALLRVCALTAVKRERGLPT